MLRVLVERAGEIVRDASFISEAISVGREAGNDVVVDDPLVSARHLSIRREMPRGVFSVIDSSSNGTYLGGERISILRFDHPTSLTIGDLRVTLIPLVRSDTERTAVDPYASTAVESLPPSEERRIEGVQELPPAEVRCLSPGGVPRAIVFQRSALIGRAAECDLRLSSPDISRRHCLIVVVGSGYMLKRLSKKNPVAVNDRPLEAGQAVRLEDGDVITICDQELVFFFPATRPRRDPVPMEAAPNVDLAVTRRACSDRAVGAFDVVGFLGSKTWPKFEERLMAELESRRPMLLDLGYLLGLDGSGIGSLVRVVRGAGELGVAVQLIRVTPRVSDLLSMSDDAAALGRFISRTEHTAIERLRDGASAAEL